jgi:Domain of unknown function (DUF4328)
MADYWLRSSTAAAAQGPYRGSELKAMAAAGSISPNWLISQDGNTWHVASQVKGLFPTTAAPVAVAAPAPPPPSPSPPVRIPPAVAALSAPPPFPSAREAEVPSTGASVSAVEYFTPGPANTADMSPPSSTIVTFFYIAAAVLFLSWVAIIVAIFAHQPWVALGGVAFLILSDIAAAIIWLVWVYQAHAAVQILTGGAHSITPGTAVGYSFIPFFSAFWVVYMPARLAERINRSAPQRIIPVGGIMTLQIASIPAALFLPGLIGIFYAVSMTLIQNGFKRLGSP